MAELRARAEREQLLNRIGEAMRATLDPDEIQTRTASLLAEALGADRCYVATYELERGVVSVRTDWHRPGLESIKGDHAFSNTKRMFDELYRGSPTSIVINRDEAELSEQTKSNMQGIGIFSRVSVAFADPRSGHMATLTAAMSHSERRWTDEEVELVQKTATLLRSAVETARVSEREHNIATQLQEALLPKIPEDIPSLTIKSLMAPALDEAAVGGDFCDVFALTGSKYAIVIGDVSGKGLAAAAQLATVRNSLRATLYLYRSPMAAVASVNAILTANQLLVGFVTAFVGLYDTLSGELVYTTCGHEPGLLLRADKGTVEWLSTPGLPLGVTDDEPFAQATVNVAHGDTLVLYTDGISEAGHDRRDLLGLDRLACIVEGLPSDLSAEAAANQIVHSAREHARGTFRDDVCVLVARRI
jgi:sigma-B regulation protein RsbU (phosphoserine phosphatase)